MQLWAREGRKIWHSVREDFGPLLRASLRNEGDVAALGPIYGDDPAGPVLAPFIRSARESGISIESIPADYIATPRALEQIRLLRDEAVKKLTAEGFDWYDATNWTRAGLVLEVASRTGFRIRGATVHVRWKLRGTVTGRFGVEPGGFMLDDVKATALTIPADKRHLILPSHPSRMVAAIDFRAMDLCSMLSLVPGLAARYEGALDLHGRTAELVGLDRDVAKKEIFVHAYGGYSSYASEFNRLLPELGWLRERSNGEGARLVQSISAKAFRGALSQALPLLIEEKVMPMFAVHDELVIDVADESSVLWVQNALELGAGNAIGRPYSTGAKIGRNYAEAK